MIIDPEIAKEPAVMVPPPPAAAQYTFPSRARLDHNGDDQIVNAWWRGTVFNVCPACFRVPRGMTWGDFVATVVAPWAAKDPDFDVSRVTAWKMDDTPIDPNDDDTIEGLGIEHKGLVSFELA
ncbi:MAG: phenol hydroxylase subunit P4 [Propionibacteriaceae bacterium]|nr:phenol hydroxylase subunit P4 [Propionibacteriaceae bacterium]